MSAGGLCPWGGYDQGWVFAEWDGYVQSGVGMSRGWVPTSTWIPHIVHKWAVCILLQ